uniref:Uncharacterized protein n=1 Tax=Psilocybe cubensis TaxID=181762 RepID=A0A8H7XM71_PSICU
MQAFGLRVTFPYESGTDYDFDKRIAFWDSPDTIKWFKNHGYALYRRSGYAGEETITFPVFPSDATNDFVEANYPYAHHDLRTADPDEGYERDPPLLAQESTGKIAFAQDSLKRHVAIKLVRDDTEEYRVLRFLSQQSMDVLKANCIIPVLDLLPIEGFWFAVMPRWGTAIYRPAPKNLFETIDIIHAWLKV